MDAAWADAHVNPHHPLKMFKVYTQEIKKGQEACLGYVSNRRVRIPLPDTER